MTYLNGIISKSIHKQQFFNLLRKKLKSIAAIKNIFLKLNNFIMNVMLAAFYLIFVSGETKVQGDIIRP